MIDYQIPNINEILKKDLTNVRNTNQGRVNLDLKSSTEKLYLQRVSLDEYKRDAGGQDWSSIHKEQRIYCAFNDTATIQLFVIAPSRKLARQRLHIVYGVRFIN